MPEASIHKDGHLTSREDDVRFDPYAFSRSQQEVFTVAEATRVQSSTERHLGLGVSTTIRPHVPRPTLAERGRINAQFVGDSPLFDIISIRHEMTSAPDACQVQRITEARYPRTPSSITVSQGE